MPAAQSFYHALSNCRRRHIIRLLADESELSLRALSAVIARHEQQYTETTSVSGQERKAVYTTLYQSHKPVLLESNICRETDDGLTTGPNHELAVRVLELVEGSL